MYVAKENNSANPVITVAERVRLRQEKELEKRKKIGAARRISSEKNENSNTQSNTSSSSTAAAAPIQQKKPAVPKVVKRSTSTPPAQAPKRATPVPVSTNAAVQRARAVRSNLMLDAELERQKMEHLDALLAYQLQQELSGTSSSSVQQQQPLPPRPAPRRIRITNNAEANMQLDAFRSLTPRSFEDLQMAIAISLSMQEQGGASSNNCNAIPHVPPAPMRFQQQPPQQLHHRVITVPRQVPRPLPRMRPASEPTELPDMSYESLVQLEDVKVGVSKEKLQLIPTEHFVKAECKNE